MKIAVITPYYQENIALLERVHRSVKSQTYKNIRHFMISDGFPNPEVDGWDCEHIKTPNAGDFGDTPRGIGAAIAAAQGYDAIAFIDADCWYEPDHIEEMLATLKRENSVIATCPRNLYQLNGVTFMCVDRESDGVSFNDTNCYLFTKSAFAILRLWLMKDKAAALTGDRQVWQFIREKGVTTGRSMKATVNYVTDWAVHYRAVGLEPPPMTKIIVQINGESKLVSWGALMEYEKRKAAAASATGAATANGAPTA